MMLGMISFIPPVKSPKNQELNVDGTVTFITRVFFYKFNFVVSEFGLANSSIVVVT